ncbi:oxidoreductase, 2OG-Fe(II) oxygenase family, putative [Talaromyces stipitatus ATCC 10500]|uniref:Oxidoreductase, 2OG-Fe(II) oxygenase family, putative n=1 Tax=Talaromyces stipitatus (strain ATCC 10500 / CBS 375.48 / QM 6759 / NRRL 1006) TaxID=441959 RepID=B8LSY5_TALSN|nr:oxidoreductase, 2OG-Fe(II) oxygenase family, putative [Talaromyces stipitatus ATCC 10500]EED22981.1 oxidoreductase, 2OG-Fe(II) oxygenase family, putative [Talaromyces stipitatus ATCC 10500]
MDHENLDSLPPFPDDVPTILLDRLSLTKLLRYDSDEYRKFCRACENIGFFYLDLRNEGQGDSILSDADELFKISEQLFALDFEEKSKYDHSKKRSYYGYKPLGAGQVDEKGNLDSVEFYNIAKDDLFGIMEPLPQPDIIQNNRYKLKTFVTNAHAIVRLVLDLLNEHLQLPPSTLANMHCIDQHSGDQIRMTRSPPQPMNDGVPRLAGHTDFGSITVLFNRLGGLQVLPPGPDAEWKWVKPLPGHCIINLGDSLVKFTNGLLRSNIHRVISSPGEQARSTRYSLVYFSRPEDNVLLKRLEGSAVIPPLPEGVVEEDVSSKDWVIRRALANRTNLHDKVNMESALGTEKISRRIKV